MKQKNKHNKNVPKTKKHGQFNIHFENVTFTIAARSLKLISDLEIVLDSFLS